MNTIAEHLAAAERAYDEMETRILSSRREAITPEEQREFDRLIYLCAILRGLRDLSHLTGTKVTIEPEGFVHVDRKAA